MQKKYAVMSSSFAVTVMKLFFALAVGGAVALYIRVLARGNNYNNSIFNGV